MRRLSVNPGLVRTSNLYVANLDLISRNLLQLLRELSGTVAQTNLTLVQSLSESSPEMSFFGSIIKHNNKEEIHVPSGFTLTLLMATFEAVGSDLPKGGNNVSTSLRVKVASKPEINFQLASFDIQSKNCPIQAEFSHGDSPIELFCEGFGQIHVTGRYGYDAAAVEEEEEEIEEKEEDQEEIKKEYKKKRNIEETEKESSLQRSGKPSRLEAKKKRKQEREELDAINARLHEYANTSSSPTVNLSLPPWKVKPEGGEGVVVPAPTTVNKQGVMCTDYVVGGGKVPRLGAMIKLTYEGMFPSGKVFDKNLKRSKPLSFRKGAGQVVRGMDIGIENMRVGGSRQIVIPPHLG